MSSGATRKVGARELLRTPSFRRLWAAHSISQFGDGLTTFAVFILVSQWTSSAKAVAAIALSLALPQLALGPLAGVFVDRWDRKRVLLAADILRCVLVLGLVTVRRAEDVWIFYVLGFAQASVSTFFDSARSSLMPSIVGRDALLAANGLFDTSAITARLLGTGVAGVLVGLTGDGVVVFGLDAATFLVSSLFIVGVLPPPALPALSTPDGERSFLRELGEGISVIGSERVLLATLVAVAAANLALAAASVLFVPFMGRVLHVPTEAMGIIELAEVIGSVIGGLLVIGLSARLKPSRVLTLGVCAAGIAIVGIGGAPTFPLAVVATLFGGLCFSPVTASMSTLIQKFTPTEKRGRVTSSMNSVFALGQVVSVGAAGILGDAIGLRNVFYLVGLLTLVTGCGAAIVMRTSMHLRE